MSDEKTVTPASSKTYTMGNVGDNATAIQGENNSVAINALGSLAGKQSLTEQFQTFLELVHAASDIDDIDKQILSKKLDGVAKALPDVDENPTQFQVAFRDIMNSLKTAPTRIKEGFVNIIKSEPAQKALGAIAEGVTKAAISYYTGS